MTNKSTKRSTEQENTSVPNKKLKNDSKPKKLKTTKATSLGKGKTIVKSKGKEITKGKPLPKETAKSRKERKILRKKQNPVFELSVKAKKIWEKLRIQKNRLSAEEKGALVQELMSVVTEHDKKLINLAYAHDTSRVLQTCLKQGNKEQREEIFKELNEHIVHMCKDGYAKNIVWKMLKYGTPEERGHVMKSFNDKAYKLIRHSKSAAIVEYAYNNYATAPQRNGMITQLYGKVFRMCRKSDTDTLSEVLEQEEDKKESILGSFKDALVPLVDKSVVIHTIVHKAFYDFFEHCDIQNIKTELIELLRDSLVHMMHTRDGAHVTMNCLWHGSKKDRKVIVKSMKEFVVKLSCEQFGHLPLLTAFDCVDDTVFLKKALILPIVKALDDLIHNKYGRKVVLYLISPRNSSHFLPETVKSLSKGDDNPTSKKAMEQRYLELSEAASPGIIEYLKPKLQELVFDRSLFVVVETVILRCHGDTSELIEGVLSIADMEFVPGQLGANGKLHIIEDQCGHLLIKMLINAESKAREGDDSSESKFSNQLLKSITAEKLASWSACNRGTQILLSLVKSRDENVSATSKKILLEQRSVLEANASVHSTKILLEKLDS
uniref:Pumilio domain-containing protein KIAA0020 homolog n=1 Tax=Phallusia mammillata TaxID=59560 RepID=A0A6F9DPF0_9ASCI|nr:pumilio domain-containing protein KIAA0020 homolog [Phallusia mammillata]